MQGLGAVSMGLQGVGQAASGFASLQQGAYNRKVADISALAAQRDASAEESRVRKDVRQQIGEQLASQGMGGFALGTGSNADAIMESQINGLLDVLTARRGGKTRADAITVAGRQAQASATASGIGALFDAGSTFAGIKADYSKFSTKF